MSQIEYAVELYRIANKWAKLVEVRRKNSSLGLSLVRGNVKNDSYSCWKNSNAEGDTIEPPKTIRSSIVDIFSSSYIYFSQSLSSIMCDRVAFHRQKIAQHFDYLVFVLTFFSTHSNQFQGFCCDHKQSICHFVDSVCSVLR